MKEIGENTQNRIELSYEESGPWQWIVRESGELLPIHPFREGNGRLARWLSELMLLQAGLPMPLYQFTGKGSVKERERITRATAVQARCASV